MHMLSRLFSKSDNEAMMDCKSSDLDSLESVWPRTSEALIRDES